MVVAWWVWSGCAVLVCGTHIFSEVWRVRNSPELKQAFLEARLQQIAETTSVAMLALLSLLDLVYMLRSTLAATLLK